MVEVDTNFQHLLLKPDHHNRPLWVTPDNRIFLETFSPIYKQVSFQLAGLLHLHHIQKSWH